MPQEINTPASDPNSIARQESRIKNHGNLSDVDAPAKNITIKKLYFYSGPNYYLDRASAVFNINFSPLIKEFSLFKMKMAIVSKFPQILDMETADLPELFAQTLIMVQKCDLDLFVNKYDVLIDEEEFSIAVEYLDDYTCEDAIYLVVNWFESIVNPTLQFNFSAKYKALQATFDKSVYGGPTIYSLIEAGMKRGVPVNHLPIESQFQWGYGRKSIRGKSTVLDVDGIKDTEFTQYKDACKEFLLTCGFPTPKGKNCFDEEGLIAECTELGFPVVVKPLAGHKGEGVTTGITTIEELKDAFQVVIKGHQENGTEFQGAIVEQQIYGKDHRLLTLGGKFVAALEREPAFVIGDGKHNIQALIDIENETNPDRSNNSRAPLSKIKIDEDLIKYLTLQTLSLKSVIADGVKVYLRRVANISAGGISTNVTDIIHPKNKKLTEDIASFFRIAIMGIDVLAADISKPWDEGNFGIIEINAGPGIYMHLAPFKGGPVDVPNMIIDHFFPTPEKARIPIIISNKVSLNFCQLLYAKLLEIDPKLRYFGFVVEEGAFINGHFFTNNKRHDKNVEMLLRHIGMDFVVFTHTRDNIHDDGIFHSGADIVILDEPNYAEKRLEREMLKDGYTIDMAADKAELLNSTLSLGITPLTLENKDEMLLQIIEPLLPALLEKYR